jgi:hypothetical protein
VLTAKKAEMFLHQERTVADFCPPGVCPENSVLRRIHGQTKIAKGTNRLNAEGAEIAERVQARSLAALAILA